MFRLQRLTITNIRSIEHLDVHIDPDATTALFGPSGVGKSGILDSLPWCLWGDSGSAGSASAMRREGSTEPAEVTATVLIGDDVVVATRRMTRSRSGTESTSARLTINGIRQNNMSAAALTRKITEMTGLTAKTFRSAFYMAQDQLTGLMTGAPAQVQQAFEELTGLDELGRAINLLRDRAKEGRIRADALPGSPDEVGRAQEDMFEATSRAAEKSALAEKAAKEAAALRQAWTDADGRARELQQRERDARASQDAVVAGKALSEAAEEAVRQSLAQVAELGQDPSQDAAQAVSVASAELGRIEASLAEILGHGATLKAAKAGAESAARHRADAEERVRDRDRVELAAVLAAAEHDHMTARRVVIEAERAHTRAHAGHEQLTEAISKLSVVSEPTGACCPTCQQPLRDRGALLDVLRDQSAHAAAAVDAALAALSEARTAGEVAEQRERAARDALADAEMAWGRVDDARQTADASQAQLAAAASALAEVVERLTGQRPALEPDRVRAAALSAHAAMTSAAAEVRHQLQAWKAVQSAYARLEQSRAQLESAERSVLAAPDTAQVRAAVEAADAAHRVYDAAREDASEAAAEARSAETVQHQAEDAAAASAMRWDTKQEAVAEAETARIARELVVALRRDLLTEYCEAISAAATEVMLRLGSEHVGFVLDSTFTPKVVLPDGSTRPTRQLSGGEKARAAVCAFIGISRQLVGSGRPGMIVADEITAAQDETFRREMLMMLRSLEMPLIVVSHTADVLDIASTVIRLQRPPMGSTQIAA